MLLNMGKVFTYEEVVEGRVPQIGAHDKAAHYLLDNLKDRFLDQIGDKQAEPAFRAFDGAMVYGSVAQGTADRRSDLDVLITYDAKNEDSTVVIDGYRNLFKEIESKWHVSVESNIWRTGLLKAGVHTIDAAFVDHLDKVGSEWRVGDPLQYLQVETPDFSDIFLRYYAHKARSFTVALSDTRDELNIDRLQRALELPTALGRKALSALGLAQIAPGAGGISKAEVSRQILELVDPNSDTGKLYTALIDTDKAYSDALESVIKGYTRALDLKTYLPELYRPALGMALRLTEALGSVVMRKLDQD